MYFSDTDIQGYNQSYIHYISLFLETFKSSYVTDLVMEHENKLKCKREEEHIDGMHFSEFTMIF